MTLRRQLVLTPVAFRGACLHRPSIPWRFDLIERDKSQVALGVVFTECRERRYEPVLNYLFLKSDTAELYMFVGKVLQFLQSTNPTRL